MDIVEVGTPLWSRQGVRKNHVGSIHAIGFCSRWRVLHTGTRVLLQRANDLVQALLHMDCVGMVRSGSHRDAAGLPAAELP
eukprot:8172115-Lingulodinium_polyedra.AAC.1